MTSQKTSPIFVLGAPYSGQTTIAWSLAQSPSVHHVEGATWLTDLCTSLAAVERVGRQVKGRGASITSVGHLVQSEVGSGRFWGTFGSGIDNLLSPPAANGAVNDATLTRLLGRRRAAQPFRRWLSAEPELHGLVHGLSLLFPDAQFLHVVRRPETSIAAMTTRSRANPQPLDRRTAAQRWLQAVRNGLDAERAFGRAVHRVEYERMAVEPEAALRSCMEFLGLPWTRACTRPVCGSALGLLAGIDPGLLHHLPEAPEITELTQALVDEPSTTEESERTKAQIRLKDSLLARAGVKKGPDVSTKVRAVRALVGSCVPKSSRALIVSRGEDALLDIEGVEAQHFPQIADGVYAGYHPADSTEAIAQVEKLRGRGAQYLVVPRSSFWWFDYYGYLREHLLTNFRMVGYQPDAGVVFNLAAAPEVGELFSVRYSDREAGQQKGRYAASRVEPRAELGRLFHQATDHFLIAGEKTAALFPEGWPVRYLAGWRVGSHPALPVRELIDEAGEPVGLVLGHAIAFGESPAARRPMRLNCSNAHGFDRLEQELYRFTGRYVCLVSTERGTRLYLDAGGTLGAVHSLDRQLIASTTSLLQAAQFGSDFTRPDPESFPADRENQYFPAGLTHLSSANRVLPNHYLDLDTLKAHRHWPAGDIEVVDELGLFDRLHQISSSLQSTMVGLQRAFDIYLGLTSGRDSRALLACSSGVTDAVAAVTFDYGARTLDGPVDLQIAGELAGTAGIPHVVAPAEDGGPKQRSEYLFRIGHAGHWGKERDYRAACTSLRLGRAWVSGFFGELGRGYYWGPLSGDKRRLSPEALLDRMRLPCEEPLLGAMRRWLAGLPDVSPQLLLDLLYLEHRGGCWASAHLYGMAPFETKVAPFADRRVIEAMFALPHEYRATKCMHRDLIKLKWPELLQAPFGSRR